MWLIRAALRRPITVLVAIIAVALTAAFAVNRMRADIFPDLDLPVIYVAQPYGGMSPAQMEGFITYYYEYHFLYINGIESVKVAQSRCLSRFPTVPIKAMRRRAQDRRAQHTRILVLCRNWQTYKSAGC